MNSESLLSPDSLASVPLNSCFICRSRKVRCDKTYPECAACRRIGVNCPGYDEATTQGLSGASRKDLQPLLERAYRASGIERRRIGACENCQSAKTRCSRELPKCKRCMVRNMECTYDSASARSRNVRPPRDQQGVSITPSSESSASLDIPPIFGLSSPDGADSMGSHQAGNNIESVNESSFTPPDDDLWLFHDNLPTDIEQLRTLSDLYFSRVHTRRCLGFIYRPTWMQCLDQGILYDKFGEALVALVCALGARCLSRTTNYRLSQPAFRHRAPIPGHKWAERAKMSVLSTLMQLSLRNVMALTLLTEYCLQVGQFADAFQLLGNCYRSIRLLSLDSPAQYGPAQIHVDMTQKESQVRIVWACYTMDNVLSAGVPQNSSWLRPPCIPLPISDSDFLSQMYPSTPAPLDLDAFAAISGVGCLSPRAHYIYLSSLRNKALRMIRNTMTLDDLTSPDSPYLKLINEIDAWYSALPEPLLLSAHRIYALQEMKTLSATMHLHLAYHAAVAALTRISLPGFNFPLSSTMRRAPPTFISQCQTRCRYHSDQISRIIEIALPHGMEPFDDQFCGIAALEASKVQIIHAAIIQHGDPEAMQAADRCIRTNLALMEMTSAGPNLIPLRIIVALLKKHSFIDLASSITEKLGSRSLEKQPTSDFNGTAENCYLTAIAPFRIAREGLQASDLSSPASINSIHTVERSIETAPPLISINQKSGSQNGDADMAATGEEWADSHINSLLEDYNPVISNMEDFDMTDLDLMNDGTNYAMWNHISLGIWSDVNPAEQVSTDRE